MGLAINLMKHFNQSVENTIIPEGMIRNIFITIELLLDYDRLSFNPLETEFKAYFA